jgi:hypothetical protein
MPAVKRAAGGGGENGADVGESAWVLDEFWEEENQHGRASIYTTQIISSGSR